MVGEFLRVVCSCCYIALFVFLYSFVRVFVRCFWGYSPVNPRFVRCSVFFPSIHKLTNSQDQEVSFCNVTQNIFSQRLCKKPWTHEPKRNSVKTKEKKKKNNIIISIYIGAFRAFPFSFFLVICIVHSSVSKLRVIMNHELSRKPPCCLHLSVFLPITSVCLVC